MTGPPRGVRRTPASARRERQNRSLYRRGGKRAVDLLISLPAVIVLTPVMATIALLVRHDLGPPVLFRQARPGLNGQIFEILKFRSMTGARDSEGHALPDDSQDAYAAARAGSRQTPFGIFLRRTSLDELPELFNVIRGQMSLVGPRPLLVEYLGRYSAEQARRHEVRPGITGWAQVHGRQAVSYEHRFELDVWYVDNVTLWLDLKIMALTAVEVFRGKGVHEPGYATGTEFMGSQPTDGPHVG